MAHDAEALPLVIADDGEDRIIRVELLSADDARVTASRWVSPAPRPCRVSLGVPELCWHWRAVWASGKKVVVGLPYGSAALTGDTITVTID